MGTQTGAAFKYVILFALVLGVLVGVALGLKYVLLGTSLWPAGALPACPPVCAAARPPVCARAGACLGSWPW